jgi:glutaryl-CoA dehydrogenase
MLRPVWTPDEETRRYIMTDPITEKLVDNIGRARGTDYFLMKEQLKPEEAEILRQVREFGEAEVLPIVNSYWERGEFPFELVPKIAALNLVGDHNMRDYGCRQMSAVGAGLVMMELSRIDSSIATFFAVHLGLAMQSINLLGS